MIMFSKTPSRRLALSAAAALLLGACGGGGSPMVQTPVGVPTPEVDPVPVVDPPPGAEGVIKIGHVGPTSGFIAHLGKDNENGARMAIDELNAANLTIAGKLTRFELIAEDDAADPTQAIAAAKKVVAANVAGVIGHLNSGTTIPVSQIYNDAGIPQISPSSTNPKYTRQGYTGVFRMVADDVRLGGTLGRFAVESHKAKIVAVIDDRTAYGEGVADEFEKGVADAGGTVLEREFTTDKSTDFSAILTKLKALNPDIVFFGGMDAVAGPMLRQMKTLGFSAKFFGGDGICTSELPKLAGEGMVDGQIFCAEAGGVEGEQVAGMDKFRADFKAKFGTDVQLYAPYAYDAVKVMVNAMVTANSSDPANYLPALKSTDYKGVTGNIAFDEKGDIKNSALTLMTYLGGTRTTIAVLH